MQPRLGLVLALLLHALIAHCAALSSGSVATVHVYGDASEPLVAALEPQSRTVAFTALAASPSAYEDDGAAATVPDEPLWRTLQLETASATPPSAIAGGVV